MTSATSRLLVLGVAALAGCEALSSLVTPVSAEAAGNLAMCKDYVAYMNAQSCLGLEYEADNFCQGVEGHFVDLAPFYTCLKTNTVCDDGEPSMTYDGCSPPLASQSSSVPPTP